VCPGKATPPRAAQARTQDTTTAPRPPCQALFPGKILVAFPPPYVRILRRYHRTQATALCEDGNIPPGEDVARKVRAGLLQSAHWDNGAGSGPHRHSYSDNLLFYQ